MFTSILQFIFVVLFSGAGYFCATIFPHAWILMWIALLSISLYALQNSWLRTACAALLAFFIGSSASPFIYWHTELPMTMFLYGVIFDTIAYTILLLIFRFIALRSRHWLAGFVFAFGWVAYDFLGSLLLGGSTYSSIAYTQLLNLPLLQLASVTGIWGITFLLVLIPVSIALAWRYRNVAGFKFKTLWLPFTLLIVVLLFGSCRLLTSSPSENAHNTIKIAIISPNFSRETLISAFKKFNHKAEQENFTLIQQTIKSVETLAVANRADVILLPETVAIIPTQDNKHILQLLSSIAKRNKITLVIGLITEEKDKAYNSAYMFLPDGKIALRHDKIHLVPGPETEKFVSGNRISIFKTHDQGTWGVLICRDMDYEQPARKYGQEGVGIVFVPSWDFDYDAWLHGRYAHMRAVENGYAVARAGRNGFLILVDSCGRIMQMLSVTAADMARTARTTNAVGAAENALIGMLNIDQGKTFYSKHGDWFAWLNCLLFGLSVMILPLKRKN